MKHTKYDGVAMGKSTAYMLHMKAETMKRSCMWDHIEDIEIKTNKHWINFNKPKSYRSGADSSGDHQTYGVDTSGDLVGVSVAGCSWTH